MSAKFIYGHETIAYAKAETAFATPILPVVADGMLVVDSTFAPDDARENIPDLRQSRFPQKMFQGRTRAPWTINTLLRPGTSKGNKPNGSALWRSIFGNETVNSGTSITYTFKKYPNATDIGFSYYERMGPDGQRHVNGGIATSLEIGASLNGLVTVGFSGDAPLFGQAQGSVDLKNTLDVSSEARDIVLDTADHLSVGTLITVDSQGPYIIAAIDYSTGTITTSTDVAMDAAGDDDVVVAFPVGTFPSYSEPIHGKNLLCSLDGGTTPFTIVGASVSIPSGMMLHETSGVNPYASDVAAEDGERAVTVTLNLAVEKTHVALFNEFDRQTRKDVLLTLGENVAGSRLKLDLPSVEFPRSTPTIPPRGMATLDLTGTAMVTGVDEDGIQAIWD